MTPELLHTRSNQYIVLNEGEGRLEPHMEIVLLTVEPDYVIKKDKIVKDQKTNIFRFGISEKGLEEHIRFLSLMLENMKQSQKVCDNSPVKLNIIATPEPKE